MNEKKSGYKKDVAFINREKEKRYLRNYIDIRPESILFLHGPKSSGKTVLLYKFLEQIEKEQQLDVKFLNLRKVLIQRRRKWDRPEGGRRGRWETGPTGRNALRGEETLTVR